MKSLRDIFDLRHKKSLRLSLLLLSALLISSATVLVYGRMTYQKPLNVDNPGAVATGLGVIFSPVTILILALSVFVISLSIIGFLREAHKHISKAPGGRRSSTTRPGPTSLGEEEWEESPTKEEESSASSSG